MNALAFLSPSPSVTSHSSMERYAIDAGATMEERDGWNVAISFPEEERVLATVGFADLSHIGKIEVQASAEDLGSIVAAATGGASLQLGRATRADDAWWCPYSPTRALVLCSAARTAALRDRLTASAADASGMATVIDLTTAHGAMAVLGPMAREVFARFTAIDLRPQVMPVNAFRPGSVARTGGAILCEAPGRYVMLFGAALGQYVWTVVDDAARHLGGGPIGYDALPSLEPAAGSADGSSPETHDA